MNGGRWPVARISALFQVAVLGGLLLLGSLLPYYSLIITAWIATLGALLAGILLIPRIRREPRRNAFGLLACVLSFVGWGSWIVAWWQYGDLHGPIINITWFLAFIGAVVHIGAAVIPTPAPADGRPR